MRVRLSRHKTWYLTSEGVDKTCSIPAKAMGTLRLMLPGHIWRPPCAPKEAIIRVTDEPPDDFIFHKAAFSVWFDEYPAPRLKGFGELVNGYFPIEGSEGDPLPPYLEAVEADPASQECIAPL